MWKCIGFDDFACSFRFWSKFFRPILITSFLTLPVTSTVAIFDSGIREENFMAQSSTSKALVEALGCFSLAMLPEVRMILEFFWRSELRAVSLFWAVKQRIFFIKAGLLAVVLILFYGSWCCDKALTMVLMCPCRPHRLLRDEDHSFHRQNCEKSWNYWCA